MVQLVKILSDTTQQNVYLFFKNISMHLKTILVMHLISMVESYSHVLQNNKCTIGNLINLTAK